MEKNQTMSLLSDAMEDCVILDKVTAPDGYGGFVTAWKDGAAFTAAITFNTSMEARTAEKQGVTSLYTVTTSKALTLEYHMVFRRQRDQKIFRVTSDGDDSFTPSSSTLDMRQVTAEEWTLNDGQGTGN